MIILKRNIIYPFLLVLSLFVGLCSLYLNVNNYYLSLFTFLYYITIPGFLVYSTLGLEKNKGWIVLFLSVGLSLAFLLIPGIIFNYLWILFSDTVPLETVKIVITYFSLILILFPIAYLRNPHFKLQLNFKAFISLDILYFLIPPLFVFLSIFGAFLLNNNGNNIPTLTSLVGIAVMMLFTIIFYKKIHPNFLPWSIYFYSLALLLSLSLRSNYVSGWDIQSEFSVFQGTKNLGLWTPTILNGAYNACLSITLLPTIFFKLFYIPDDYIFKFLYQILFAITPVIIFYFFKRYTSSIISFIAVIYIISQPLFIQPMTALMRQEIAFIFFMLLGYILFDTNLTRKVRIPLVLIFSICLVFSHYSTTYITLLMFTFTFIFTFLYRLTERIPLLDKFYTKIKLKGSIHFHNYYLNPLFILFLLIFTFFWYGTVNNQLGQVQRVATEGISKMNELFQSDSSSSETKQAVSFLSTDHTKLEEIEEFTKNKLSLLQKDKERLYDPEIYLKYDVYPLFPSGVIPYFISPYNRNVIVGLDLLKQFYKLLVILGPLYFLIFFYKKHIVPREYIIYSLISVIFIFLVTFHPYISRQYNLARLYLQLLFYLSLPAILLSIFIFLPFKKYAEQITGILVIILYLYLIGIPYQFFGGESKMYLNNYGADYDKFYMHKSEFSSAIWVREKIGTTPLLYADREAYLRIYREIERGYNSDIIPALIYKDAYVYGSYSNIMNNRTTVYAQGKDLIFNFPKKFLEENKNVIYSNGQSAIYR